MSVPHPVWLKADLGEHGITTLTRSKDINWKGLFKWYRAKVLKSLSADAFRNIQMHSDAFRGMLNLWKGWGDSLGASSR